MKRILLLSLVLILSGSVLQAQPDLTKVADSILNEATRMYKLEKASLKSSDILLEENGKKYLRKNIDGNLSYFKADTVRSIYWKSIDGELYIVNTFNFKNEYSLEDMSHEHLERAPNEHEIKLIGVRHNLVIEMANKPFNYTRPTGSKFKILLTEKEDGYRAYLFVDFKKREAVPFGNDYMIEFNQDGDITIRKRLHQSYLETPYTAGYKFKDYDMTAVLHTHLEDSPFITATDICLAMLFAELVEWDEVIVVTDYISTYNLRDGTLRIEKYEKNKN